MLLEFGISHQQPANDGRSVLQTRFSTGFFVMLTLVASRGPCFGQSIDSVVVHDVEPVDNVVAAPIDLESSQLEELRADIRYLASEELLGRSVADDTIQLAASYISDRMQEIGLDTDLYDGSPFQKFNVTLDSAAGAAERNRLRITSEDSDAEPITAGLDHGMSPMAIGSLSGTVTGRVVFAGYGITAEQLGYDDYAKIDVGGAIVIILRKEPGADDPGSPFGGTRNTQHAYFETKIANAISHGASAVLLVNDSESVQKNANNVRRQIRQEEQRRARAEEQLAKLPAEANNLRASVTDRIALIGTAIEGLNVELTQTLRGVMGVTEAGQKRRGKDAIPVASIARDLVDAALQNSAGGTLSEIEKQIGESYLPQSAELSGLKARLQIELEPSVVETSNVIGVLPGRGALADQSVVIGAHYDHVGMGGYGSLAPGTIAIHNGADDNASGTATMLSTAANLRRRLANSDSHRRLIFIAFTGEERGLLGSRHYVGNPRFPLESTVAMVNMDMVGRLKNNELTVYGTGSGDQFDSILESANEHQQFRLFKVASGYGPSDHQSFYVAGVPVLFFFTGLHNDYHRPSDDFDKINFGGLTRITDTISEVAFALATRSARPKYASTETRVQIRRQMTAYLGVSLRDRGNRVILSGISPGGPAERAGLRVGDQIHRFGGLSVQTSAEVLEAMRERSPDDLLSVKVIRDRKIVEFKARLTTRPEGE